MKLFNPLIKDSRSGAYELALATSAYLITRYPVTSTKPTRYKVQTFIGDGATRTRGQMYSVDTVREALDCHLRFLFYSYADQPPQPRSFSRYHQPDPTNNAG